MRLSFLGPAEIVVAGRARAVGSPRERVVLAVLALNARRLTPVEQLVDAVWGAQPPPTARTQVQICVSALRRRLAAAGGGATIATRAAGYELAVEPGELDIEDFAARAGAATTAAGHGDLEEAAALLRGALALWRGPAFADVDSDLVRRAATGLTERRWSAVEERVRLDLALGRHVELVGELAGLVAEQPLRENLHRDRMLALYRAGRQADALAAYQQARRVLVEEIGVEPGRELRELERAVLARDPALDPAAPAGPPPAPGPEPVAQVPVPRQLPASLADFTGRAAQLEAISARLTGPVDPQTAFAVQVVGICGAGGVGKSTLAVRAAHQLAGAFPDGQLYADLHQDPHVAGPDRTATVLARFLRALGMAEELVPAGLPERAETYRSRIAGRRILVVLDGVTDEDEVQPLLPGTTGSAVIITSRLRPTGLPGVSTVDLDVLDEAAALALLRGMVGAGRVADEPDAARELVAACDRLPLALRIAGAKLAARPHWRLRTLVDRLRDERGRLDELTHRGLELRSTIGLSHRSLDDPARRLFGRLALPAAADVPEWVAGALLDGPDARAEDAVADLVAAHLVGTTGPADRPRLRFHDLVRVYAGERLAAEDTAAERDAALTRVLGGWLALAERVRRREYGDLAALRGGAPRWTPPEPVVAAAAADPMAWLEAERGALVAAVGQAAATGRDGLCWELALAASVLLEIKGGFDDWRETAHTALAAATRSGDRLGAAASRYSLGALLVHQGRPDEAETHLRRALAALRELGHDHGIGLALRQLAVVERLHGDPAASRAASEEALPLLRAGGDRSAQAHVRSGLAKLDMDAGDLDAAGAQLDEALALARAGGALRTEAQVLYRFADLAARTGRPGAAREALDRVLAIASGLGDRIGVGYALFGIGRSELAAGRRGAAAAALRETVELAGATGDRNLQARARRVLGELAVGAAGEPIATR